MPEFNFDTFLRDKDSLAWRQVLTWKKGIGAIRHLVWKGFLVKDGKVSGTPSYFAYVSVNDEQGTVGISLAINVRFDIEGKGQKFVDNFIVGRQEEISDQLLVDTMRQRYGLTEMDFTVTPVAQEVGAGDWTPNDAVTKTILRKKMLVHKTDRLLASVFLRKITYNRGLPRYKVEVLVVPVEAGISSYKDDYRSTPFQDNAKDANADFSRTIRELSGIGFAETIEAPEWANGSNWDFELGLPIEVANKMKTQLAIVPDEYEEYAIEEQDNDILASVKQLQKRGQDVSQYYSGPLPDASQLQQYVGTSSLDASQIKAIFGGVDDALSLVNQFDSSLLLNVAFIYNFSGGGAYGVYMSALDEKIKNEELKKLLKMAGYALQDAPNGSFYATHKDKTSEVIDKEIAAYRDKIGKSGATTFGIDMNKVIGAAKADCQEGKITDPQDQHLVGVLHLGATMAHEAVHSQGSQSEGPSENVESRFMTWALPVINKRRQDRFVSQGKKEEYSPLIIDPAKRRMASSNWLVKAIADGGTIKKAQFEENHHDDFIAELEQEIQADQEVEEANRKAEEAKEEANRERFYIETQRKHHGKWTKPNERSLSREFRSADEATDALVEVERHDPHLRAPDYRIISNKQGVIGHPPLAFRRVQELGNWDIQDMFRATRSFRRRTKKAQFEEEEFDIDELQQEIQEDEQQKELERERVLEMEKEKEISHNFQYREIEFQGTRVSGLMITKYIGSDSVAIIPSTIDGTLVTRICENTFYACPNLTSIVIPSSITNIENWVISFCDKLTSIYFEGNHPIMGARIIRNSPNVTIYCRAGTSGWNNVEISGRPVVVEGEERMLRTAQYGAQFLQNQGITSGQGQFAFWQQEIGPIETLLDRARPVVTKRSKLNFEGQLREMNKDKWCSSVDAKSCTEELLEPNRSPLQAYRSTEQLIGDAREKPLMLPVKGSMSKKASSYDSGKDAFGWMANLDIEMEERVQLYTDGDGETTNFNSGMFKDLSRYNPEYGNPMSKEKDVYYVWSEPRFEISKWDDYMNERPGLGTGPFQRAASDKNKGGWFKRLLDILRSAIRGIITGKIHGTRFICNLATAPLVNKFYENDFDLKVKDFDLGNGMVALWVSSATIPEEDIEKAEDYISGKSEDDSCRQVFLDITGIDKIRSDAISKMIEMVGSATRDAKIERMLILGDLPLAVALNGDRSEVRTVDFCSNDPDVCIKIGEAVSSKIGCISYIDESSGMFIINWKCVIFRFRGEYAPEAVVSILSLLNIDPTPINIDIYSRGITPLMLAMDVVTEKIIDPTGEAMPDIDAKVVRSAIDPVKALSMNSLFVFDAIFVASKYDFVIDSKFTEATKTVELTDDIMSSALDVIRSIGKGKTSAVAEEYNIKDFVSKITGEGYANTNQTDR